MLRSNLVAALDRIAPGLSTNDLIPVLSHVWITGTHLMSYNDCIAISVPFKSDFIGAVPGKIMIDLVKNSLAKECEFVPEKDQLLIKAASSRFKLASLPRDAFKIFTMPKMSDDALAFPAEFFDAVSTCLQSTGSDPSLPEQLGVTLIPDGETLFLFSTNNRTITREQIKIKKAIKLKDGRVTIPTDFCKEMVSIAKDEPVKLEVHDDHVLLSSKSGASLFGRLVEVDKPLDFHAVVEKHMPIKARTMAVEIPSKLAGMIERAVIITEAAAEQTWTAITVADHRMKFFSKSSRGTVTDEVLIGATQPEIELAVDCKNINIGYGHYDRMLASTGCFVMMKGTSLYLVGAVSK